MAYPDNAFAKGYSSHGGSSSADIVFISSKAPSPYHGTAFQLMSLPTGVVPDSGGDPHPKKTVTFIEDYSSSAVPGAPAVEQFLYAVTDNVQLTPSGNVFMTLFPLPYFLKIEPGRFVLLKEGSPEPLFKFNADPALVQSLSGNISGQTGAVEKALSDHRKWLAWAGPTGLLLRPIQEESDEARNLGLLKLALEKAAGKLAVEPVSGKIPAAQPAELIRLIPGLYLTRGGSLLLMFDDGSQATYVLPGLLPSEGAAIMPSDPGLSVFLRSLLVNKAGSLPPDNPARWLGEMSEDDYKKLVDKQ